MKSFYTKVIFILMLTVGAYSCDKEFNDGVGFCSCLTLDEIYKTIPLINDFLAELPDGIGEEQTFESLEKWLNSFPCNIDAKILYGIDMVWGKEQMYGVSISVRDSEIKRELELDFAIIDNAITYSQIAGYVYSKQDVIHVKTIYSEIDEIFGIVNSLEFDVKAIQGGAYLSSMLADADTLQHIINNLKTKPYTTDSWVTGHLNWYEANIVVFLNLYDMKNATYQVDWIETMNDYKLESYIGGRKQSIEFYIPEGTGEQWKTIFTAYDFVDWAELSYTRYTIR